MEVWQIQFCLFSSHPKKKDNHLFCDRLKILENTKYHVRSVIREIWTKNGEMWRQLHGKRIFTEGCKPSKLKFTKKRWRGRKYWAQESAEALRCGKTRGHVGNSASAWGQEGEGWERLELSGAHQGWLWTVLKERRARCCKTWVKRPL